MRHRAGEVGRGLSLIRSFSQVDQARPSKDWLDERNVVALTRASDCRQRHDGGDQHLLGVQAREGEHGASEICES